MEKQNVLIYGLGNFYSCNEEKINAIYNVKALIDREKKGWYAGKEIVHPDSLREDCDKVLIMIRDIQENILISKKLISQGIKAENILLGCSLFGEYSKMLEKITVSPDGDLLLKFKNVSLKVKSKDEFNNIYEVFCNQSYDYYLNNDKKDIILDIGLNVGGAALYFLLRDNVEKVYGYEPFKETFLAAKDNLKDYLSNGRVEISNYGISNENATRMITYNRDMSCGQSTLYDVREKAYGNYKKWGLVEESNEQKESIRVKRASEVFIQILEQYPDHNVILKMDCEGEEYGILEEMLNSRILHRFSFIMLEWHYRGKEDILHNLKKAGMSWWCCDKNAEMGLIYAFKS